MNFLYTAYISTWVIHIGYLTYLARRYSRLRREMEELNKKQ